MDGPFNLESRLELEEGHMTRCAGTLVQYRGWPALTQPRNPASFGIMDKTAVGFTESQERRGGEIPGLAGQAAFALIFADPAPVPVLIAVPHAGRRYPPDVIAAMRDPAVALRLEDRLVDLLGEAIAHETGAALLMAHAPRAMIDLNRAPDDIDWSMVGEGAPQRHARHAAGKRARSGLGLVPRRLPGFGEIWRRRLGSGELDQRLKSIHQPYHTALGQTLDALHDRWGAAVLIDLHSMPPLARGRGEESAPLFVVGDRFGASAGGSLASIALDHFTATGWRAAHNRPYAGGYVLDRHGAPARGIHALQIEVCRSAYLDHDLREPAAGLSAVVRLLSGLVRRIAAEVAGRYELPQAAE